jgi:ribokinase
MSKKKILIIGSSNTDMVIKAEKIPRPGETILGGTFLMNPGGKGANQAVSAARLDGNVTFISKTGNDLFGDRAIELLIEEGIDVRYVVKDPVLPSGVAIITVDALGENSIAVAPGSNGNLLQSDIPSALFETGEYGILLLQLEIPMTVVEYSASLAINNGIKVILNPAPARNLPDHLLKQLWLITPNETEAEILTGLSAYDSPSAEKAAYALRQKGVKNVIITMGSAGAYLKTENFSGMIPAVKVTPVDTTAAGDVFNGAIAVALSEGKDLREAVDFANKAASISVTRMGAQASAPYRNEINY